MGPNYRGGHLETAKPDLGMILTYMDTAWLQVLHIKHSETHVDDFYFNGRVKLVVA